MDSSSHKLAQPHKGVWGEAGGVLVVPVRRIIGAPLLDKHVPGVGSEGLVGSSHKICWRDVRPGWGGGI